MTLDDISPATVRKFLTMANLARSALRPDSPPNSLAAQVMAYEEQLRSTTLTRDVAGFLASQTLNSLHARALEAK